MPLTPWLPRIFLVSAPSWGRAGSERQQFQLRCDMGLPGTLERQTDEVVHQPARIDDPLFVALVQAVVLPYANTFQAVGLACMAACHPRNASLSCGF